MCFYPYSKVQLPKQGQVCPERHWHLHPRFPLPAVSFSKTSLIETMDFLTPILRVSIPLATRWPVSLFFLAYFFSPAPLTYYVLTVPNWCRRTLGRRGKVTSDPYHYLITSSMSGKDLASLKSGTPPFFADGTRRAVACFLRALLSVLLPSCS